MLEDTAKYPHCWIIILIHCIKETNTQMLEIHKKEELCAYYFNMEKICYAVTQNKLTQFETIWGDVELAQSS